MRYEKTVCDGCKKIFKENDDVVVCPVCGTPQHRECYEKNGGCVNSQLHETGFSWHGEIFSKNEEMPQKKGKEEPLVCPSCGHSNPPGTPVCEVCGQKFTFFGVNLLEREIKINEEIHKEEKAEEEFREIQEAIQNGTGTGADIERMLDARAKIVAPGLSKEQEQEMLCSHPIKRVLVFISGNALRYVNKFRKTQSRGGITWNWAAFFFSPYWFFYRKLYKLGSVFLTFRLVLSTLAIPFVDNFSSATQTLYDVLQNVTSTEDASFIAAYDALLKAAIPIYIISGIMILLAVVSALIADGVYKKYVTKKLTEAEQYSDPLDFSQFFLKSSGVNVLAALFSFAVGYLIPNLIAMLI